MSRPVHHGLVVALAVLLTATTANAGSVDPTATEPADAVFDALRHALQPEDSKTSDVRIASPSAAQTSIAAEKRCAANLAVHIDGMGTYRTAEVSCQVPRWTLYIGVVITQMVMVAVAIRTIPTGTVIAANDFKLVELPLNDLNGPAIDATQVVGARTSVPLSPGTAITRNSVVVSQAVANGQDVEAQILEGDILVRFHCRTLQAGAIGDTILAVNPATGKRIEVYVAGSDSPHPSAQPFIIVR
jgi:flagella basal body P-ring formation protein FlgA